MSTTKYQPTHSAMIEVPIDTFRGFVKFIGQHDLWSEVQDALKSAGMDTVPMNREQVRIISGFVTKKADQQPAGGDHADALVTPECGCNAVHSPGTSPQLPSGTVDAGGNAGAGDAGTVTP